MGYGAHEGRGLTSDRTTVQKEPYAVHALPLLSPVHLRLMATVSPGRRTAENARLSERVIEVEHQLHPERSRHGGLGRGLSALSRRVVALRKRAR
jgi:hypothetical protein